MSSFLSSLVRRPLERRKIYLVSLTISAGATSSLSPLHCIRQLTADDERSGSAYM